MIYPMVNKPRQDIPEKEKDKEWYRDNAYWLLSVYFSDDYIVQRNIIRSNQKLRNGDIDEDYINYLIYPEGKDDDGGMAVSARFENYPLIQPLLEAYQGDYLTQELDFTVDAVNSEAYMGKMEKMISVQVEKLVKQNAKEIQKITGINIMGEEVGAAFPDAAESIKFEDFREQYEDTALNIMKYLKLNYGLQEVFRRGCVIPLLEGNSCAFAIRRNSNNDPIPEPLPIENLVVIKKQWTDTIEDSDGVAVVTLKSASEIIELWGDKLDDTELKMIEKMETSTWGWFTDVYGGLWGEPMYGYGRDVFYENLGVRYCKIIVVECLWKSRREIYIKESKNKYDEGSPFIKRITPEAWMELDKDDRKKYKKSWFPDNRKCILIGHQIIIDEGREENQIVDKKQGVMAKKFSITGIWNNAKTSVVSVVRPLHYMYCVVWFHIDRLLAQAGSKAMEIYMHERPDGWTYEQWIFYAKQKGFLIKQWREENSEIPSTSSFNSSADFSISPSFGVLVNFLVLIETTASKLIGMNAQRLGQLGGVEGLGVSKINVQQSVITTLPFFHNVRRVIDATLNIMLDKARKLYASGETKAWFGDKEKIILKITEDFKSNYYGLFLKNSSEEKLKRQQIEGFAEKALSSGGAEYFDLILEVIDAETSIEAKSIARRGFQSIRDLNRQMQQQQIQSQQAMAQAQQGRNEVEQQKIQTDYSKSTDTAKINAQAKIKVKEMEIAHDENKSEIEGNDEKERFWQEQLVDSLSQK